MQAASQCVVGKINAEARVFEMHQSIKQVPAQIAALAVVPALDLVAAFVVVVVGAGVFAQQVVDQFAARWGQVQWAANFCRFVVEQVAGRVEGEGFHALTCGGAEQTADRIVAIGERAATAVVDVGQLAGGVVAVFAFEQRGFVVAASQQLFLQTTGWIPALGLQQVVALMAGDFAVQVVAFVADQFVLVQTQAEQVAAAVRQPADAMAVGAHGGDSLVEHVVLVLPDRDGGFFQAEVMLVLAQQIAGRVVEPLQAAVGVVGQHQVAVAVVGKGFALRLLAQGGATLGQTAHRVEAQRDDALAIDRLGEASGERVVLITRAASIETAFLEQTTDRVVVEVCALFVFVFQSR
ncbi:hypothetical protein PS681_06128 [Pseudomonas fluorescens]|nr:hypothetical protein PS681_06128 [Pseudomonas fluorescens]